MQTLGRKCESSTWHIFWLRFNAISKSKHSWAKIKRAKFDSDESYKTFAKRHHRRRHNEFLKQQASKGWDDVWDTPKGAARARQVDDMASTLPDEQLWMWMTQGSASARTARQQRKAWRAWTKQFQEAESYWQHDQSAQDYSTHNADTKQQEQSSWSNSWQHFGSSQHSNPWQDYFTFSGKARSGSSQKRHRQDAGRKVYQAQQQHCMQVLGLAPTVSLDAGVIRTAFLECAKRWHPDRHMYSDDAKLDAESKFKDAQTAYQHLLTCL